MGDRYRKYVDKRAIKMPMKIGSSVVEGVPMVQCFVMELYGHWMIDFVFIHSKHSSG